METIFLVCAALGGTLLLCQFALTLVGLSHGESWGDADPGDLGEIHDGSDSLHHDSGGDAHHSSWLFGLITYQTLVAAATFFGLVGMTLNRAGASPLDQLLAAACAGVAAMFGVQRLMRVFRSLNQNGVLRVAQAKGARGKVSVPIPADMGGTGKVLLEVQGRLEELPAMTKSRRLPTGTSIHVVGILGANVLEVEPAVSEKSAEAALNDPSAPSELHV